MTYRSPYRYVPPVRSVPYHRPPFKGPVRYVGTVHGRYIVKEV
jgi:hypothetical protein